MHGKKSPLPVEVVGVALIVYNVTIHVTYRVYSNRMQAKKIITILTFAQFSDNGRHLLH